MGVRSNLNFKGLTVNNAYLRLARVFGGKDEGVWGSVMQLYPTESGEAGAYPDGRGGGAKPSGNPLDTFNVTVAYQDSDPRPLIFAAAKTRIADDYSAESIADVFEEGQP